MRAVVEHRGDGAAHVAEEFVLHDDEGDTGHGEVLLRTAVDHAILADINGTGEDVARHVGHEGHGAVEVLADFGTVDGIVGGDVEIVGIGGDFILLRDEGVVGIGRRGYLYDFAEELGLLQGLLGPNAGVEVGGFLLQEVVRNHAELQAGAATHEEHGVTLGDVEQFLEKGLGFVHHSLKLFGAVADFHQRKTHIAKFYTGISRCLHHFLRQD